MSKSPPAMAHSVSPRPSPRGEEAPAGPATSSKPYSIVQTTTHGQYAAEGVHARAAPALAVSGGRVVDDSGDPPVQAGEGDPLDPVAVALGQPAAETRKPADLSGEPDDETEVRTPEDDGTGTAVVASAAPESEASTFTAGLGHELFGPSDDMDLTQVTPPDDTALSRTAWLGQWGQAPDAVDLDLVGAADLLIADDSLGWLLEGIAGPGTAAPSASSVEQVLDRAGSLDVEGVADLRLRLDLDPLDDGSGGLV